jgi:hypothetical protein
VNIPEPLPAEAPRLGNSISRWIGLAISSVLGWRFEGRFPPEKKLMVILAPHTSNWDFLVAMPFILALNVKVSFLMKKEAFFWPFKRLFMWLGGVPTDRSAPGGLAQQVASLYKQNEKMWVAITPEGTRKKVDKWKNGFLRIAYAAEIPVLLVAWDFERKCVCIDSLYQPTRDMQLDMQEIQRRYSKYRGCIPENQTDFAETHESAKTTEAGQTKPRQ